MNEKVNRYLENHKVDCPRCGYTLRGLAEPVSPECGTRLTMAYLLGPRHRALAAWEWAGIAVLAAANVSMLWYLWYHPVANNPWEMLFVRFEMGRRTAAWQDGGFGLLPIVNFAALVYVWYFDVSVAFGAKRWHVLALAAGLTVLYVGIGLVI
ncbi:MAG TPA: hypothetical protein VD997_16390 [Phycisphaerales bacterium]|nr:hypothetical protein [Phycisphaerales bacterium]